MACERCGGLMIIDIFFDLMEEEFRMGIDTARCLNCGNFEDTIICTNRTLSRVPRHFEPHTRKVLSRVPTRSCPFSSWRGPFRQNTDVRLRTHRTSPVPSYRAGGGGHERHKLCLWERSLRNVARHVPVPATGVGSLALRRVMIRWTQQAPPSQA